MRLQDQDDVLGRHVFHAGAARENLGPFLACLTEVLVERACSLKEKIETAKLIPPLPVSIFFAGLQEPSRRGENSRVSLRPGAAARCRQTGYT